MQHATRAAGLVPRPQKMFVMKKRRGLHRATKDVDRLTALLGAIGGLLTIARELVALLR